jgi:hypothetical protein
LAKKSPYARIVPEERDVLFPPFTQMAAAVSGRRFLRIGKETIIEEIKEWLNRAKNARWRLLYFGG